MNTEDPTFSDNQKVIDQLERLFVHRRDTYGVQQLDGTYTRIEAPLTVEVLENHLKGEITVGAYLADKDTVKWICGDFDGNDDLSLHACVTVLRQAALDRGVPKHAMLIENSGRRGYHLWIFFAKPVSLAFAHNFGMELVRAASPPSAVKGHIHLELFPKQAQIPPDRFGNLVKLPLGTHRVSGKRSFFCTHPTFEPAEWGALESVRPWIPPHELVEKLSKLPEYPERVSKGPLLAEGDFPCWVKLSKGQVPEGTRHDAALALASHLRDQRLSLEAALAVMRKWWERLPQPPEVKAPRPWENVRQVVIDAYKHRYSVGCKTIREKWPDLCDLNCPLLKPKLPEPTGEEPRVRISDLRADMMGKKVVVDAQIVGERGQMAIPKTVMVECSKCAASERIDITQDAKLLNSCVLGFRELKKEAEPLFKRKCGDECPDGKSHSPRVFERGQMDYAILWVRDPLERLGLERFTKRSHQAREIHLAGPTVPDAKKVRVWGEVAVDKKRNITVVANRIEPLESEVANFAITDEDKEAFLKHFTNGGAIYKEIAPHIVGSKRDIAKKMISLAYHSPPMIPDIHGRIIRGTINVAEFGDTTAGKSQTAKDLTDGSDGGWKFSLGVYVLAETGGRTGLLYTIDNDRHALIWGELVLNDLGLVVIDGLEQISPEEFGEFRETIRTGKVSVRRALAGDAWARTRIITCFNPKKPMNQYLYPCQAVADTWTFESPANITRWDIFVPFALDDVPPDEITNGEIEERPIPPEVFARHVWWAWSRKSEDIIYEREAVEEIKSADKELIGNYASQGLPIVSNESFATVCRFAVARAAERHSTDEAHEKIIVKPEHVRGAVEDYKVVLETLQLRDYVLLERGKLTISEGEFAKINGELDNTDLKILESLALGPKPAVALGKELGFSPDTIKKNHYPKLVGHELIDTTRRVGATLTARGTIFMRHFQTIPKLPEKGQQTLGEVVK